MSLTKLDAEALVHCSREPIHIPGAIQPHGVLLVFEEPARVCVQVSSNIGTIAGWSIDKALGKSLSALLGQEAALITAALDTENPALESPVRITLGGRPYDALLHRHDGLLILELEPGTQKTLSNHHRRLQAVFSRMRATAEMPELYRIMAEFISRLSGYERVMVYRFDADWHGEVVGEHLASEVDSYFGHHFPASDIPEQARALYVRSWLRIIPDASYTPVPLEPLLNPVTGRPLDLSFSMLRSVSPVHLEYLRNMDVAASMSVSIIIDGRLWGLIACHHSSPRILPYAIRAACELFGQVASLEIASKEETKRLATYANANRIQTRFFDVISREQNFVEALVKYGPEMLRFMSASGAVLYVNQQTTLLGETPSQEQVRALTCWIQGEKANPLLHTDHLSYLHPPAAEYTSLASGMLAVKLSAVEPHYVIFFRPEVVSTMTWAGNPHKPVESTQKINPRKSFASWKQTITGHSIPWKDAELQGARELRTALNALVLRRTERLIRLNGDLEKKNTDLNSFAHIASHDLREPLRGIFNYCKFIQEDHGDVLPADVRQKLQTISNLASQSNELLNALNHFAKVGRMEVAREEVSLEEVLERVLSSLSSMITERGVQLIRPRPLPTIHCDQVLMREVFSNLISNAIRYNESATKIVEIGWKEAEQPGEIITLYVKDNGIGILEKHHDAIFTMFRRLHAVDRYEGGTGAGLAIVRGIIERHGGTISVQSAPGAGSIFQFTLA